MWEILIEISQKSTWKWIVKEINTRDPDNDNWKQYYKKKAA